MSLPDLPTFLNRKIDHLHAAFPQWRLDRRVNEDELHENLPTTIRYASKPNGLEIECDAEDVVKVIYLHSSGHEGFEGYPDPVAGVELSWDRTKVRARLGPPSRAGEAKSIPGLGSYGPWDRYDFATHSIHFQFHPTLPRVSLITIMAPDSVPG